MQRAAVAERPVRRFRILSVSWLKRDGATWRLSEEATAAANKSRPPADASLVPVVAFG
jgi:hypothetical protein